MISQNITEWIRLGMRKAFGVQMTSIASQCDNIIVLTADVANSGNLEQFQQTLPNQFFNVGIAEQNMTGIACGLAKEGYNVFISSFAPFVSMRNYEAIRTLVGYMQLNVKIVALASGMSLGVQGNTHFGLEDISLMHTIPEMLILSPADVAEEAKCLEYLSTYEGPAYLRLTGIDGMPCIYKDTSKLDITKPNLLREGENIVILATGSIVNECIRVTRLLKKDGISCALYDICCLKPLNIDDILVKYNYIVTVEEHFTSGGLGSIIATLSNKMNKIIKLGIKDKFPKAGHYTYMLEQCGLTAQNMKEKIISAISEQNIFRR